MNEEIEWKLTDPDNLQYGRRLSTYTFEFKEYDRSNYEPNNDGRFETIDDYADHVFDIKGLWVTDIINLETYTAAEIIEHTEGYYENLDELFSACGADSCFIIAECIFEQTNGLY